MKYLKYYYIFNEAKFSTELDVDSDEKEFLDKVRNERPNEYSKYLTYIKNKGVWYAKNKYNNTDPKKIKEKEKLDKDSEKYSEISKKRDFVRNLIPKIDILDKIFLEKFQTPYNDFWEYFYGKCPYDFFHKEKNQYENTWNDNVIKTEGRYCSSKRASCSCHKDGSYLMNNTPSGLAYFLSQYIEKNPNLALTKFRKIKPLHIFNEDTPFQSLSSEIRIYIHTSRYAVSTEIHFDISFGIGLSKYNEPIFRTVKKTGNLKRGVNYEGSPEITQQDVINCINNTFDEVILEMEKKKQSAKYNTENLIFNLINQAVKSGEFIKLSKEHKPLYDKIIILTSQKDVDSAIEMDDMGFND